MNGQNLNGQKKSNSSKITIITISAMVLLAVSCILLYIGLKPQPQSGEKSVTVTVTDADGSEQEFLYNTDCEYLGELLRDEQLASGEQSAYGLYIKTVNGYTADESKEEWWCITKDKGTVYTGADTTPVSDGDRFEITLITGYDVFYGEQQ